MKEFTIVAKVLANDREEAIEQALFRFNAGGEPDDVVESKPVIVTVSGGVAELHADTVPEGITVEIVDLDELAALGGNLDAFIGDGHASQEAMDFLRNKEAI